MGARGTILVEVIPDIIQVEEILDIIQEVEILAIIQEVETLAIIQEVETLAITLEATGLLLLFLTLDIILETYLEGQDSIQEGQVTVLVDKVLVLEDLVPKDPVPVTNAVGWPTTTAVWEASSATPTMSRSARGWTDRDARLSPQNSARTGRSPCAELSGSLSKQ